jgi:hypothetical protein
MHINRYYLLLAVICILYIKYTIDFIIFTCNTNAFVVYILAIKFVRIFQYILNLWNDRYINSFLIYTSI